jgi:hypothetical protein
MHSGAYKKQKSLSRGEKNKYEKNHINNEETI